MSIYELRADEMNEVKCMYYTTKMDELGKCVSYGEYAAIDELVSDEEMYEEYGATVFSPNDFWCNAA